MSQRSSHRDSVLPSSGPPAAALGNWPFALGGGYLPQSWCRLSLDRRAGEDDWCKPGQRTVHEWVGRVEQLRRAFGHPDQLADYR
jgi:hypothetical protein